MIVHDIEMDQVGTGIENGVHILSQASKIS
jgi:hypothetical protein